jgi:hypothetical protein
MKVHWLRHPQTIRLLWAMTVNLLAMGHNLLPMLQ